MTAPPPPPSPRSLPDSPEAAPIPRVLEFALALTALVWAAAAAAIAGRAAQGITLRLNLLALEPLLECVFLLFLAVLGFRTLDWIATRGTYSAQALGLPRRATRGAEWATGAAAGWALALATVLPLLLTLNLHSRLTLRPASLAAAGLAMLTLLFAALAEEVIFRGYAFQRLIRAVGPSTAAVLTSVAFALFLALGTTGHHTLLAFVGSLLLGLLLATAWLRTHALWLGWGLHFAYRAVTAVALGLPVAGRTDFGAGGSLADSYASGPRWLTGGGFGLDAALLTGPILLAGLALLYRLTRDYAWTYTHTPIVAAGYEVVIAPPAAHVAMEKAAAPPPLVQIASSTPQTRSVAPPPPRPSDPQT